MATEDRGYARCGTKPNTSRHELTTAMQHLSSLSFQSPNPFRFVPRACPTWVRFFALRRIKHMLHRLCGPPSIPLSFNLAAVLPRRCTYCVSCGTGGKPPTLSAHRLGRGLPGYLILFAPHAFAPQRQVRSRAPPSPPAFFPISTHFTATPGIPRSSPVL